MNAKIVFVNRYFYPDESATSQLLTDLACGLAARGARVEVVTSRQLYGDARAALPAHGAIREVLVRRIWTTRFGRRHLLGRALDYLSFYASAACLLVLRLRRRDVVVALTDPPLISVVALTAARLRGAFLVNWLHDLFPDVARALQVRAWPDWVDELVRLVRDRSLRGARANIVLGARMAELVARCGAAPNRIRVIENWADSAIVAQPPATSKLRAAARLNEHFVVAYSGNFGRAHEFSTLLGAATILADDPRIVFLMIGDGARLADLRAGVAARGLRNFRFLPHQPRELLSDALASGDAHVVSLMPAAEGLIVPSKFYGILAAGRPCIFIGNPQGEIGQIARAEEIGVTVEPGEAEALAAAIRLLRDSPKVTAAMGRRARHLSESRYGTALALESWVAALVGAVPGVFGEMHRPAEPTLASG
jgi:glycosyltransferase involved in cell wall biosynthesis